MNRKSSVHWIWIFFNVCVGTWAYGSFWTTMCTDPESALFAWRVAHIGVIFIPVTFYHFAYVFTQRKHQYVVPLLYCGGLVFLFLDFTTTQFLSRVQFLFDSIYYAKADYALYFIFFVIWLCLVIIGHLLLIERYFKIDSYLEKTKIQYLLFCVVVGFMGGLMNFFPILGFNIYPYGNASLPIYLFVVTYAILRFRLIEISIVITRTSIFLAVYSVILGIPFVLAFGWREHLRNLMGEMWWMAPLVSSTVLATVGPSIYLYIQRRAEDRLLQEQRRYQTTLRRASLGMGRVKDLNRLLKLTVNIVTRTVRIEHCEVYLTHRPAERYVLKASQGWALSDKRVSFIPADAPLIQYLKQHREPLVYDEVKQRGQDFQDKVLEEIGKVMEELDAALLVPSFIEEDLIAVLVLGRKRSGKLYSQDDLIVFSILANQVALAIENAQFYEDMKKTHDQLMKAEKMATIGTMADGLSHQINNRLHAMGFIASDALDTIKLQPREALPPEAKKVYEEMEVSLGKIQENVKRGGEIVEGLLKYSRKTDEGFTAIELGRLLDAALEMAQFKIKLNQIDIARDFNGVIPRIRGNFTQLQEVFFNMVDNSYDAMMQRKEEMKEPGYRGRLEVSAQEEGNHLEIFIKDNGIGVKEKDFKRLFTPFFTTKLSSKKGTGLGLYVIRKIIEENHGGKVEFTSEYQKGSQTRLVLPIAA
ncbi:MAG: GAF domain-containing protein [Candidatus Omnitrophica bacterium]|nr:GAF domain-containing protein [Candidatus Omnitrophota bacterium]